MGVVAASKSRISEVACVACASSRAQGALERGTGVGLGYIQTSANVCKTGNFCVSSLLFFRNFGPRKPQLHSLAESLS